MEHVVKFLKKSSWGIHIKIDFDYLIVETVTNDYIKVTDKLFIKTDCKFVETELSYISSGLNRYANHIEKKFGAKIFIFYLHKITYAYTDFQEDALFYLFASAICKVLDINDIGITSNTNFIFDKINNIYVFPDLPKQIEVLK